MKNKDIYGKPIKYTIIEEGNWFSLIVYFYIGYQYYSPKELCIGQCWQDYYKWRENNYYGEHNNYNFIKKSNLYD